MIWFVIGWFTGALCAAVQPYVRDWVLGAWEKIKPALSKVLDALPFIGKLRALLDQYRG